MINDEGPQEFARFVGDGSRLLFNRGSELKLAELDKGSKWSLTPLPKFEILFKAPWPTADGRTFYFHSEAISTSLGSADIWVSRRVPKFATTGPRWPFDPKDGREYAWNEPVSLGPKINTAGEDKSPALTEDQLTLVYSQYVAANDPRNGLREVRRAAIGADWNSGSTLFGANLGYPSISADGLTLVANIDLSANNTANRDIVICTRAKLDGSWSQPTRIADPVNSPSNDYRPILSPDARTLVFSSNRAGGVGGLDLYITRRNDTKGAWSTPINLGPTVNSSKDDAASQILADGTTILFHRGDALSLAAPNAQGAYELVSMPQSPPVTTKKCWLSSDGLTFYFDNAALSNGLGREDLCVMRRVPKTSTQTSSMPASRDIVYLDDLTEIDSSVGYRTLMKHGQTIGDKDGPPVAMLFKGQRVAHSLMMRPPTKGVSFASYQLDGRYKSFTADVGLPDNLTKDPESPVTFRVLGDGKEIWKSDVVTNVDRTKSLSVAQGGVKVLRLEVKCDGKNGNCHASWVNPRLTPADLASPPSVTPAAKPTPPIPAEALTFNGHRYLLVDNPGNWIEAKNEAEAMGGHLVTITSRAERDWILENVWKRRPKKEKLAQGAPVSRMFIGARQADMSSPWTWVTGEPFDDSLWLGSKPNGSGTVANWSDDKTWDDVPMSYLAIFFLVEWDTLGTASSQPVTGTLVDLRPAIDVVRDSVAGDWTFTKEGVNVPDQVVGDTDGKGTPRLQLPYTPPEEYDLLLEFTPSKGTGDLGCVLRAQGRSFVLRVDRKTRGVSTWYAGFGWIDGKRVEESPTSVKQDDKPFQTNGQRHLLTVEVRRDALRALLDGELLVTWSGDWQRLNIRDSVERLPDENRLGLISYGRGATYHSIQVREVTGRGMLTVGTKSDAKDSK